MPTLPSFERTTAIVARGAGVPVPELLAGLRVATAEDLQAIVALRREVYGGPVSWDDSRYLAWRYGLGSPRKAYATLRILTVRERLVAAIGAEEVTVRAEAASGGAAATGGATAASDGATAASDGATAGSGGLPVGSGGAPLETRAACAMDLLALPALHEIGIGAWLNLVLFREYPLVIALGANSNSAGLVQRLYTSLPGRRTYQLALDAREFLSRRIHVPLLREPASAVLSALVSARNRWFVRGSRIRNVGVEPLTRFGEDWDEALRAEPPAGTISMRRHADYLNWRFVDNPRGRYRILAALSAGRPTAYVIFRMSRDEAARRSAHIADWWIGAHAAPGTFAALIGATITAARAGSAHYVSATALGARYVSDLRGVGFLARSEAHKPTGYQTTEPPLAARLATAPAAWHLNDLGDDGDG